MSRKEIRRALDAIRTATEPAGRPMWHTPRMVREILAAVNARATEALGLPGPGRVPDDYLRDVPDPVDDTPPAQT